MSNQVHKIFGNKVRLRVCGICINNDGILLVNHRGLTQGDFWAPPGGGINFGETAHECLEREFAEETGLHVSVGDFLFACEFIDKPLHAIELFFSVTPLMGKLKNGSDPEMGVNQIIEEVKYFSWKDIELIKKGELHGIFNYLTDRSKIDCLRGYFKL
jgi:8-oxo-dGTP diphosphatase